MSWAHILERSPVGICNVMRRTSWSQWLMPHAIIGFWYLQSCGNSTGIIRFFTKQIATEGLSTVFGQPRCALWHTKSIKPRKFGNIVKMRLENEEIPHSPHVKSCGTNSHRFSKKYRRNANFMSTYMFSDAGNTMEDEFCRSAGSMMASIQHGRHEIIPGWQYDNSYHCKHTGGSA